MAEIDALFEQVLLRGGSDLHLAVGHPPTTRLQGRLHALREGPLGEPEVQRMLDELLDDGQRRRFADRRDLAFAHAYGYKARFRVHCLVSATGPGAVFRTIPSQVPSVEQLGLPEAAVALAERRSGLVLIAGPSGSGKSTTLAALISHINHARDGHVLTIEDPLEFVHTPIRCQVTHREVGAHVPGYLEALASAAREDADVIMVGALRDASAMRAALELASDGVLVLAGMCARSAPATLERFVGAFGADEQPAIRGALADVLAGVVAQQLVRTADGTGRVAAHEVLVGTRAVAEAIRTANAGALLELLGGGRRGMQRMDGALRVLVEAGIADPRDALARALDRPAFAAIPAVRAAIDDG
ncbi:MAG: PilT/PilU family type 4a pilus ATPase [Myxococcales bacterium]|nr:PilT/PilU family type 4a pilus ATPase [Myxococcales bacterium]